ncbi:hypothetical protein [Ruminococcus sp.]|jgi:hypothetical protein|uniref:hypothetical protein n=1 Tax=Ruminococcus sp. TaxID=41978 RepID=UPI0025F43F37|nr:hypothetical protein [Ruminococcus sp.]
MRPNEYDDLLKKIKCSDEFRSRMQEKLSSEPIEMTDYEESVSGIEVAPKHNWGRFAALAAAFVLVCGAVGGGVYHFNKMKDKPVVTEEDDGTSIFDKIKANKDSCDMKEYVWNLSGGPSTLVKKANDKKDRVIEYLEQAGEFRKTDDTRLAYRSVRFEFENKKDDTYLEIDISENGISFWSEADKQGNIISEEYRSCSTQVFYDMLDLVLEDADSDIMEYMTKVSQDEIKIFVSTHLEKSNDRALFYPRQGLANEMLTHFVITDKEALTNALMNFEWVKVREGEFDYNNYYEMGIRISEEGYLMAVGDDPYPYGYFKLKNEIECEKLIDAVKSVLGYDNESRDATSEEIRALFDGATDNCSVSSWDGEVGIGQSGPHYGSIYRYYTLNDAKGFTDEISSIEWVTCSNEEVNSNTKRGLITTGAFTISDTSIYRNGYISCYDKNLYCKLKNESDIEKLEPIFNKYFVMTEASKLADKMLNGIDNFNDLDADFTYSRQYDYEGNSDSQNISGHMSFDAKDKKLYMSGAGTENGDDICTTVLMIGDDNSAYSTVNNTDHDKCLDYVYSYNTVMIPKPEFHYVYLSKKIEQGLTPAMQQSDDISIESKYLGGGNTEYHFTSNYYGAGEYTIVLTEKGQLISYEASMAYSKIKFELKNYVFDSDSFEMPYLNDTYEQINYSENIKTHNIPVVNVYPELISGIGVGSMAQVITDSDKYNMYVSCLLDMFSILDKEGGDEDFWLLHGDSFKTGSKHGDRHMKGYYTIIVETEKYEFVIYIPDLRATKPEWGDDTVLIEKHSGTADESSDSYYRHFSEKDIDSLRSIIKNQYNRY